MHALLKYFQDPATSAAEGIAMLMQLLLNSLRLLPQPVWYICRTRG